MRSRFGPVGLAWPARSGPLEGVKRPRRCSGPATRLAVAVLLALVVAACGAPVDPVPDDKERRVEIDGFETTFEEVRDPAVLAVDCGAIHGGAEITATEFVGRTAEDATYLHYTPNENWNGELVLYARGYVPPGFLNLLVWAFLRGEVSEPRLQEIVDLRDALLCAGYAFALSAYASDGYAVEEGFRDTHLLNALFAWHGEEPSRTFVVGHSMGALITTALIESFPERYEGGLATCGPVGGSLLQMDYIGNVRVVFDHLFGSDVIGGAVDTPTTKSWATVKADVEAALGLNPDERGLLAEVQVVDLLPGESVRLLRLPPGEVGDQAIADALLAALEYDVRGKADVLARGDGGLSFDNKLVAYLPNDPALEGIERYDAHLTAVDYFTEWYVSRGSLERPLRLVHSEFDADVPAYHVDAYLAGLDAFSRDRVEAVIIPGDTSHCVMPTSELFGHFLELVDAATP